MALVPLDRLEDAMQIIIETMPLVNQTPAQNLEISISSSSEISSSSSTQVISIKSPIAIEFVIYFAKQWLNGVQSPEIWNHHETIGRRTNNGLEGHHNKIESVTDKAHPPLKTQIELCKRENSEAADKFARLPQQFLDKAKDPKEIKKDEQIFLIHQEFKSIYFASNFTKIIKLNVKFLI